MASKRRLEHQKQENSKFSFRGFYRFIKAPFWNYNLQKNFKMMYQNSMWAFIWHEKVNKFCYIKFILTWRIRLMLVLKYVTCTHFSTRIRYLSNNHHCDLMAHENPFFLKIIRFIFTNPKKYQNLLT